MEQWCKNSFNLPMEAHGAHQDSLLTSGKHQHGSWGCKGRVLLACVCTWLDFVEHQSLYPAGGEVSMAEAEPEKDSAAERGILVAIMCASLTACCGSCCRGAWVRCRRASDLC